MEGESASRVWTARTTLLVFGFLALTWHLPRVVDIYDSVLYRLLFVPSYVVMLLFYDSPWGLENAVYAFEAIFARWKYAWEAGLLVTYYLVAVGATWLGRRLRGVRGPRTGRGPR